MKNKLILITIFFLYCSTSHSALDTEMLEIYTSIVDQWRQDVVKAFDDAEKEIFKIDIPVTPVGPNEDPAKCICKGTGLIKQGDDHTTPCPFHGKQEPDEVEETTEEVVEFPPLVKIKKSTCQCETKCACDNCQCQKTETELLLRKTEIE